MNRNLTTALFAVLAVTSGAAFADQGGQGQNCINGAVNQNFCGGDGDGGDTTTTTTTTDNSIDNSGDNRGNDYSDNSVTDKSVTVTDNSQNYTDNGVNNVSDDDTYIDKSVTDNSNNYTDNSVNDISNNTTFSTETTVNEGGKGGKGGDGGDASVGDTTSKSKSNSSATGGNASASGGDASATGGSVGDTSSSSESNNTVTSDNTSSVGDTTSESNNSNSNDSEGGDVNFEYSYNNVQAENAASSAASVLTGFCQTGGSAQGFSGGFTLTGNDQFCDRIRMADYYWVQYGRQKEIAATFQCHKVEEGSPLYKRCVQTGERMFESLDLAWENTEEANSLLDTGKFASHVEKATGPMARIAGILSILILL